MRRRTQFFISFFAFTLLAPLCVLADSNSIASLVFTTNPQTVAISTLSQSLTIQTENAAGTAEKVSETNDVAFTSTSATGQFLNVSGSAVSTTMSTNTASRTFYYEDSTAGTYTITATIKGRTSGKQFSATQAVTITGGGSSSSSDISNASSTDNGSATSTSDTSSDYSNEASSHSYSSQASIYEGPDNEAFDMSIGRNRLASVGAPVAFQAKLIPSSVSYSGISFHWAFGDGAEWTGSSATHVYEYPGDYIVVVTGERAGDEAVAETEVRVVSPDVVVSITSDGAAMIRNGGDDEINLGDWTLADNEGRFLVPQDTIVAAHASITIPAKVMKTRRFVGTIALYDPSAKEDAFAATGGVTVAANASSGGDVSVALPSGMSTDEFAKVFSEKFTAALGADREVAARPEAAPPVSVDTAYALTASSTPRVADKGATSSAAAVIYSVPRNSGGSVFSGIASWFGGLFGKK